MIPRVHRGVLAMPIPLKPFKSPAMEVVRRLALRVNRNGTARGWVFGYLRSVKVERIRPTVKLESGGFARAIVDAESACWIVTNRDDADQVRVRIRASAYRRSETASLCGN